MITDIINAVLVFLVIMDPFSSLPVLLAVTKKFKPLERIKAANQAAIVAFLPIIVFAIAGTAILSTMGITLSAFRIAGGIVLALLGIELVLALSKSQHEAEDYTAAAVIIAVPLITGPAVITTSIIFAEQIGILQTIASAAIALAIVWAILRRANFFAKILGKQGIEVISRIMGLLLVAIAVSMIQKGLAG